MGMLLFNKSGTFIPSNYGLSVGDVIYVVCVGGGGGGCCLGWGASQSGGSGGASSFGSILTAKGGSGGVAAMEVNGAVQGTVGQSRGGKCYVGPREGMFGGGGGAGGWYPGMLHSFSSGYDGSTTAPPDPSLSVPGSGGRGGCATNTSALAGTLEGGGASGEPINNMTGGNAQRGSYGGVGGEGGCGGGYNDNYGASGGGGAGFGAGGGCGSNDMNPRNSGYAGNSGECAFTSYVLQNTNSIAVTVGAGGTGGNKSSSTKNCGGNGAPGCVAIWW